MSEIRATTISDLAGTGPATLTKQSAAKAWANLNGTGTIALRDSFNVSSAVDNGTGDFSFNLTGAMATADSYSLNCSNLIQIGVAEYSMQRSTARPCTTTVVSVRSSVVGVGASDAPFVDWNVMGDLA